MAAAVLLSYETNADLFPKAFNYLAQARNLRNQEDFHLIRQPQRNGRATEWITSDDGLHLNEQDIQQHLDEFPMHSILIRLRIFKELGWSAVYNYLTRYIYNYFDKCLNGEDHLDGQILDISLTILETIHLFDRHEEGIWFATCRVVMMLSVTLQNLRRKNNALFNIENLKAALDIPAVTYQPNIDDGDGDGSKPNYLYSVSVLISLMVELLSTNDGSADNIVRKIVSQKNDCTWRGITLFLTACRIDLPADNLFAVIQLLLANGANYHAVDNDGRGALHYLASGSENRRGIGATARLLLDMDNGLHLDQVDNERKTAADFYKERNPAKPMTFLTGYKRASRSLCASAPELFAFAFDQASLDDFFFRRVLVFLLFPVLYFYSLKPFFCQPLKRNFV